MLVLGIETTCDETACAVVRDGQEILSNVIASQADLHAQYGGVYPEFACRRHADVMIPVVKESLLQAEVRAEEIDLIAVANRPGLIGALLIGVTTAKGLAMGWNKPFVGVNHVEAHLYAAMMGREELIFPALGVVVSGGHTCLVKILDVGKYEVIGTTVDDAIGEAFDKVASILGLPYPGGPEIEKLAKEGDPKAFDFSPGRVKGKPWHFSFSGLKTNVMYSVKGKEIDRADVAASFQEVALRDVVQRSVKAVKEFGCKAIYVGGGVSANLRFREMFQKSSTCPIFWPGPGLTVDNGAMIAGLGYHIYQKQGAADLDLEASPRSADFRLVFQK